MSLPEFKTMLAEALRRIEGRLLPQGAKAGQVLVQGAVRPGWQDLPSPTPADGSITEAKLADEAVTSAKIDDGAVTLAKLAAAVQASLMPAGAVSGTAGTTAPTGWLMCDGSAVSMTTYAELYAAIGTTYDTQRDQSTGANYSAPPAGTFRVPDYRGVFLRGVGTSSGYAATTLGATQDDATAKNGLTVSGGTASLTGTTTFASSGHTHGTPNHQHATGYKDGSYNYYVFDSGGTLRRVVGSYNWAGGGVGGADRSGDGGVNWYSYTNTSGAGTTGGPSAAGSVGISSTAASLGAGDAETRPVNVGINWMIKV